MSIFREYDIRGIVPGELNEEMVTKIGYALAGKIPGEYVAVGYDARLHAPTLFGWLAAGLAAGGKTVLDMGMVPTPVNYFAHYQPLESLLPPEALRGRGEVGGATPSAAVMITGSHNPPEYNGFKITVEHRPFFGEDLYALGREVAAMERPPRAEPRILPIRARERYIEVLTEAFASLRGLKQRIAYDCGNGVAGTVLPEIFRRLGLDATGLYVEPDGTFPHHHPDPSVEANLADVKRALQSGEYDLAFAFDGDADRLAVLTPRHNIKGDQLALLYTLTMERPTVIGEVKCSQVMYDELERRGATAIMYKTGHSNLKVKIRESGADLACEVSGHIFFADRYYGYDDAIYAALRFLELLRAGIDPDAEIDALPPVYATEEIKLPATEEGKFRLVEKVRSLLEEPPAGFPAIREILTVDGLRIHFDRGWALVRASNTTPVLVTRYEAEDAATARRYREALEALVERARSD